MSEVISTPKKQAAKSSIPDFDILKKNYLTKKMTDRTKVALTVKLVSLFRNKQANNSETELMTMMLVNERRAGKISDANLFMLNEKEYNENSELNNCIVRVDDPPANHHMRKDQECKFFHDYEHDKVIVYIPEIIPAMFQMTNDAAFRLTNGLSPKDGDFADPKTIIHRRELSLKEFKAWFDEIGDELIIEEKQDVIF